MAGNAEERILPQELLRVEAGAVRRVAPSSCGAVAGQAVAFHVAGDARLEGLPRRLAMADGELAISVVVGASPEELRRCGEARLAVTTLAELALVVAIAAARRAAPGIGRVPHQVARGVVAAPARRVGAVTIEA